MKRALILCIGLGFLLPWHWHHRRPVPQLWITQPSYDCPRQREFGGDVSVFDVQECQKRLVLPL